MEPTRRHFVTAGMTALAALGLSSTAQAQARPSQMHIQATATIAEIEQEMSEHNTNIVEVLMSGDPQDKSLRVARSIDDINSDVVLEEWYEAAAHDYEEYERMVALSPNSVTDNAALKAAVAAVIAYFKLRALSLSEQMLITARNNNNRNKVYTFGLLSSYCRQNPVIANIRRMKKTSGSASFDLIGGNAQHDLYYAIHLFSWTKPSAGSTSVTIRDTYDFKRGDYNGIVGAAIDTMYQAQQQGVIVPYKVVQTV